MKKILTNLDKARTAQFQISELTANLSILKRQLKTAEKMKNAELADSIKKRTAVVTQLIKAWDNKLFEISGVHQIKRDENGVVIFFRLYEELEATWMVDSRSLIGRWRVIRGGKKAIFVGALEKNKLASKIRGALIRAGFTQSKHPLDKWGFK